MSEAFGYKFILISKTIQKLPQKIFGGGKWLHLGTAIRGLKEYICIQNTLTGLTYIEEFDHKTFTFKQIESESEWQDIQGFFIEQGVLDLKKEKRVAI